jgi:hypothetical protein
LFPLDLIKLHRFLDFNATEHTTVQSAGTFRLYTDQLKTTQQEYGYNLDCFTEEGTLEKIEFVKKKMEGGRNRHKKRMKLTYRSAAKEEPVFKSDSEEEVVQEERKRRETRVLLLFLLFSDHQDMTPMRI